MFLGGRLGHQQKNEQAHRLLVGRIKADRRAQAKHRRHRRLQALDASMGDGHAVPESGRTQSLTRKQTVGHQGPGQPVQVLEQQPGFFKCPFLAGGFNPHKDLGRRQDGRESVHDRGRIMHLPTSKRTLRIFTMWE